MSEINENCAYVAGGDKQSTKDTDTRSHDVYCNHRIKRNEVKVMGWAKYEEDNRIIMEERWEARYRYSPEAYAQAYKTSTKKATAQTTNKSQNGGKKNGNQR